ncbi:MAG: TIGR02757 family protein [Tannerella sp.]|nr:TIGR02757 family protein [Tannerella sp.]
MDIKNYLDEQAKRINHPSFIINDPVQFPRRYKRLQDIEIVSFLVAAITWGRRPMILRNAERMLSGMGNSPYDYVMNGDYENLGTANVHRTFFEQNMAYLLRGFGHFYNLYNSMDEYMSSCTPKNPQKLVEILRETAWIANRKREDGKCYPSNLKNTALKRVNLALRWLVRNDGIVDLGVWKSITPDQLYIPLDVHVGNTARKIGLLTRKSNDWKAVEELTGRLREYNPEDPVLYDFALFGIGIEQSSAANGRGSKPITFN